MKRSFLITISLAASSVALASAQPRGTALPLSEPPHWAREAIWYQIFVERFRNGDSANDPRPADMVGAYPGFVPTGWTGTPWPQDWYEPEDWAREDGSGFYKMVQARRFGGDLQGVLDKLDYLQELGVTALYFNPLNDAPSLHKYDARHYRHIDRNFGPDPVGDTRIIDGEDPIDPTTWRWTAADRLFLDLIREVHRRGMRLIVDYSWNHTGVTFWAWTDLKRNQGLSRFRNWYDIESLDDPTTSENEFRYQGWHGVKTLPELKKVRVSARRRGYAYEGDLQSEVKQHVLNVTRRWLDPDGDGDPSDGVDGFRLDVAAEVPLGFWREYREFVKEINPAALLVGEVWWTQWPDQLMDPRPFLRGDIFDSVMHYQWYQPARRFFAQANGGLMPSEFIAEMNRVYAGYKLPTIHSLMNLTASHDSPRLATSFQNKQQYKVNMGGRGNPALDLGPPDKITVREIRMMLLHQFTYLSAPHIWNGDERGMWGADDPDCRKPIVWEDVPHRPQVYRPDGAKAAPIQVGTDHEMLGYYRSLIRLRKQRPELVRGKLEYTVADDETMTLAYRRSLAGHQTLVAFNRSTESRALHLTCQDGGKVEVLAESRPGCAGRMTQRDHKILLELGPLSGAAVGTVE